MLSATYFRLFSEYIVFVYLNISISYFYKIFCDCCLKGKRCAVVVSHKRLICFVCKIYFCVVLVCCLLKCLCVCLGRGS